jgi:D-alanyl-D-alanine carboxypeptidase
MRTHRFHATVAATVSAVLIAATVLPAAAGATPALTPSTSLSPYPSSSSASGSWASYSAAVDAVIAGGATGYAARLDDGRRVRTVSRGLADRATGRALDPTEEFQAGSNTKTFVATVALQLVGEGKLRLDDPVSRWYPGMTDLEGITLRMLLQHTSGLADYTKEVEGDLTKKWTPEELADIGRKLDRTGRPGASFSYSNTNYVLAGMILQRSTGQTPAQLIVQRIARPLGLRHTYWAPDATFHGPHMHGYYRDESGYVDSTNLPLYVAGAAGALISTLSDLARFEQALQSGRLLRPAQLAQMRHTVPMEAPAGLTGGYGLGLARLTTPCGTYWGHTGGTYAFITQAWSSSDGHRTLTQVVTNAEDSLPMRDTAQAAATAALCQL